MLRDAKFGQTLWEERVIRYVLIGKFFQPRSMSFSGVGPNNVIAVSLGHRNIIVFHKIAMNIDFFPFIV